MTRKRTSVTGQISSSAGYLKYPEGTSSRANII
jgi:hypothetical protein